MSLETLKRPSLGWLVPIHRWLGIGTGLLFALWFLSGLVMLYVGFPDLSASERHRYQARIAWDQVAITPDQVLQSLSLSDYPRELRLEMSAEAPVYRVTVAARRMSLSAVDGKPIEGVTPARARAIVAAAVPASGSTAVTTLERDQWTVAGTFDPHRPLHRVDLEDPASTQLYVSSRTGEIVLDSTARERTWNWVGSVVHWIYFSELRARPVLWSRIVTWTSGLCIFVAITGLWLGIDRLRWRRRTGSITPFRGWMAWHHVPGVVGGVVVLTWIFSGWLSMGPPVPWNSQFDPERRSAGLAAYADHGEPTFDTTLDVLRALGERDTREATFSWILGKPQITLTNEESKLEVIDAVSGAPRQWSRSDIEAGAARLVPDALVAATDLLLHEDAYWYVGDSSRALPVLRFRFDDPERTWVHVDPVSGRVVGWLQSGDRVHRWLFDGLHTFDFPWLRAHHLSNIVIWLLTALGLTISLSGIVIGWRRLTA